MWPFTGNKTSVQASDPFTKGFIRVSVSWCKNHEADVSAETNHHYMPTACSSTAYVPCLSFPYECQGETAVPVPVNLTFYTPSKV